MEEEEQERFPLRAKEKKTEKKESFVLTAIEGVQFRIFKLLVFLVQHGYAERRQPRTAAFTLQRCLLSFHSLTSTAEKGHVSSLSSIRETT